MLKILKQTLLVCLLYLQVAQSAELHQQVSDFVLGYKSCFSVKVGFDFFKNNVDAIFTEYIERYNNNHQSKIGRKILTTKGSPFNGHNYYISRESKISVTKSLNQIHISTPYSAKSIEAKATIGGEFKISIIID